MRSSGEMLRRIHESEMSVKRRCPHNEVDTCSHEIFAFISLRPSRLLLLHSVIDCDPEIRTNQLDKPTVFTTNLCLYVLAIHWSCFLCGESLLLGLWKQFIRVFFYNSRLIRWIQQNKNYKKISRGLAGGLSPEFACLVIRHSNHYTRMFSVAAAEAVIESYSWYCKISHEKEFSIQWVILSNSSN